MKCFIGIDIGKSGGIVAIIEPLLLDGIPQGETKIEVHPTPQLPDGDIDTHQMFRILDAYNSTHEIKMVTVEKVHAIFGTGAGATFEFGRSAGIAEGIVCACAVPYQLIAPKIWQKEMWQGVDKVIKAGKKSTDTKATSLIAVKRLFPTVSLTDPNKPRSIKPHDGIVDALLLAEYGRRTWKGTM